MKDHEHDKGSQPRVRGPDRSVPAEPQETAGQESGHGEDSNGGKNYDHGGHGDQKHNGHDHREHHRHMARDFKRRFFISLGLTLPVLAFSPMIQGFLGLSKTFTFSYDHYLLASFATILFVYGGKPFLTGLWDEVKKKKPGMMTLIGLAITVAWLFSTAVVFGFSGRLFYWELATLIDVMLLGHWIEMRSVLSAGKSLESLASMLPDTALRLDEEGNTEEVKIRQLQTGDRVLVKPGEKVPADGMVKEGHSEVNEAMVTGESKPVEKREGEKVIGGSVNGNGSLTVEIERAGENSYLSSIVEIVREAQASQSHTQSFADRAAMWLTFIAIGAGMITFGAWLLFSSHDFAFSLSRAVTVMVITCPHALGLAIPLVVAVSTSRAATAGLLIRNRQAFERASELDTVVFDKTGTLTHGSFSVQDTIVVEGTGEDELLKLAAAVEKQSEHPIAQAIVEEMEEAPDAQDFEAITGKGASATVEGVEVAVVSGDWLEENSIDRKALDEKTLERWADEGQTVVYVVRGNELLGAIALVDTIRPTAKQAISQLKSMDIKTIMLTGDSEETAHWVAGEVGLDDYVAQIKPDEKANRIEELLSGGRKVAMVGDGVNDAPSLAKADVGIAIGAGTDVAAETADIILIKSNPLHVVRLLEFSRATRKKMVQNLLYATGYNVVAIPLAAGALAWAGILLNPAVGAALMSLSTVVVAINARFLKVEQNDEEMKS